ncbi:hypothetical protein A0H81_01485 [Grifola frondosa]|uniref:Uncharacterized protein n=1 Tax=Grifola frondosa TaxID=5627 RepID=A0A1C7MQ32_GRIFR|nr:hypothetical protein A0H81_01485 [Grifola frondosa]
MVASLIAARIPSLTLWGTLETGLAIFLWSQYRQPSTITGPLPSAIPKGYIGKARFQPHEPHSLHVKQPLSL